MVPVWLRTGSNYKPLNSNKFRGSVKKAEFHDQQNDYELLKNYSAQWTYLDI
jgi:hypothetical protein